MAKQEIKKGSVYIKTTKGLYPMSLLKQMEVKKSSQQIQSEKKWFGVHGLIEPPYEPEALLRLYESNAIFWRCVNQLAIDVAGLGWNLQLKGGQKENKAEFERLQSFLTKPNDEEALRNILKKLVIDWGAIGWFGIEVVRNNKGEVAEIYHVPAHTLRVHVSKEKYCQVLNTKKVWFKRFGLDYDISPKTGEEGKYTIKTRANELIFYKNFYPLSDYYGAPNALAATRDILGLIGASDFNLAFFENYGVPSAIVILEGEWDEGSDKAVSDFLNKEIKGTENAHRTLVVTQPDNCKFTYKPISTEVKDSSFRLYEQMRREDILIAYSMPPERIGMRVVGKLGGNVAEEATRIYVQSVVEPLQTDLEDIINDKLLQSDIYEFRFENIDLRDYNAEVDRMLKQIEHGVLTPNEARNELGLSPYPEGDRFYMAGSLVEVGEPADNMSKMEKDFINSVSGD